jgi:hypothetical protein
MAKAAFSKKMVLELGHFGKYISNTWKVLKCCVGG